MTRVVIWADSRYPVNRKIIRKAVLDSFSKNKISQIDCEVSVAVVGKRKMKALCRKYLGDLALHEILTFPLEDVGKAGLSGFISAPDGILRLGDIVLCWPQVLEEASYQDVMVDEQVYFLICHGVDHLLGKHHDE